MSLYVDPTRSEMSAEEAWAYINKDLDEASQQHSEIDTSETGKDAVMAESVESYVAKVINVAAHDVEQDNNSQDDEKICDKTEEVINVAAPDVQQQSNSKDDEKTSDTTDEVINVAADDVKQESNSQDDEKTSDNTEVNTESNSQPVEKTKDDTDESESREYGPAGNGDGSTVAEPSIQSNPLNENVTERPSEKPDQKTCSKSDKNTVVTNTKRSSRSCNLMWSSKITINDMYVFCRSKPKGSTYVYFARKQILPCSFTEQFPISSCHMTTNVLINNVCEKVPMYTM